jgi:hypothetical protein
VLTISLRLNLLSTNNAKYSIPQLLHKNLVSKLSQVPGASEASIRDLPPSAIGDPTNFDAMGFCTSNKGKPIEAIVEQVRDGHTLRAYLLPGFQFVQVFVAGVQVNMTCH